MTRCSPSKYHAREGKKAIRKILLEEWDPIGVKGIPGAEDEYDGYVADVYMMLLDQTTNSADLSTYLLSIATERMGFDVSAELVQRNACAVEKLLGLRPYLTAH